MSAQRRSNRCDGPRRSPRGETHRGYAVQSFLSALEGDSRTSATAVREIIKARARRAEFFSAALFADPAWDMLLDLYCAEMDQRRIAVGSLCIGACVPATTALRWIDVLLKQGLIEKRSDPLDKRRVYVSLTREGSAAMREYFATVPRSALVL